MKHKKINAPYRRVYFFINLPLACKEKNFCKQNFVAQAHTII